MAIFPLKDAILGWIQENPHAVGKREIARAFGLKGEARVELKRVLRELEEAGEISRKRRRLGTDRHLPPVTVLIATDQDADGELYARPKEWEGEDEPPAIRYAPRQGDAALGPGDKFLAKLMPIDEEGHLAYEARLIKKIGSGPRRLVGIFRASARGGRVMAVDKKSTSEWEIQPGAEAGAADGELVEAEQTHGPKMGLPRGRIVKVLGDPSAPRQVSLIALYRHGIPDAFPADVLAEAEAVSLPQGSDWQDFTDLALFTIDPSDARDHDDAVAAAPDDDPANPGGHIVWVAIADVAACVAPGSLLDREAKTRGNSTYFPDRVAPMLPERLSGDLCSLREGVERPCLIVRMVLDAQGQKLSHRFERGIMRSRASLTYEQAQAAADGHLDAATAPLKPEIDALFAAYGAARRAREARQPLDLDLPERRILLGDEGEVIGIPLAERLEAHRLIEEFMILANVCAAETLERHRRRFLYRVHEEPNPEKLDALRETVEGIGMRLAKGQVLETRHLNELLAQARETEAMELVAMQVLRAQSQAYYAPENFGHFGLNLARYAHFTSPIRRYADLVVHRALVAALKLGPGGQTAEEVEALPATGEHISKTERRSMEAERETKDRYLAAYMAEREGAEFTGRIAGVTRAGLFVKLDESGADGFVPIGSLGREYFRHDPERNTLTGERSGRVIALGMAARVRLLEAVPETGGLRFELLDATGVAPRAAAPGKRGAAPRKKLDRARLARVKAKRKHRRG